MVKKLRLLSCVFFLVLTFSFVLADNNSLGNETVKINESVEMNELIILNETVELNETNITQRAVNETLENETNITIQKDVVNESNEMVVEKNNKFDSENFSLMGNFFSALSYLSNSSNYGLNMFVLGLQAGKIIWSGNDFTYFMSFNDGMTGDAESISYKVNVGPLSRFTDYEQCYRKTCSQLGKTCGNWEDGCDGPNLSCGACNSNSFCNNGTCALDEDYDLIPDVEDNLIGNETTLNKEGIVKAGVGVDGSRNCSGDIVGVRNLIIYDNLDVIVNVTHNFSAGKIYLERVNVIKGINSVIANFSSQLLFGETKTVYIEDNNFIGLCVKDAEIGSVSEISSGCNGVNEYNFTGCLGNSVGYVNGTITCTDLGSRIKVENLTHSGILGIVAPSVPLVEDNTGGSSSGGTRCVYNENYDWNCSDWGECFNGIQIRTCKKYNNCGNIYGRPIIEKNCSLIKKEKTNSEKVLDIIWDLNKKIIKNSSKLEGVITFEGFENFSIPVNLTIKILGVDEREFYNVQTSFVVAEKIFVWKFFEKELENLSEGKYITILEVAYGEGVRDEFRQDFEVKYDFSYNEMVLNGIIKYWKYMVMIICGCVVLIFLIWLIRGFFSDDKKKYDWTNRGRIVSGSHSKQSGKSIDSKRDRIFKALRPGKRISKRGKIYYEYRKNRSDLKGKKSTVRGM